MHHNGHICDTSVITGRGSQVTHYHSNVSIWSDEAKLSIHCYFQALRVALFVCMCACVCLCLST